MDLGLRGRTALITGASKGIGYGIARALAAEGCNVHLAARTADDLAAACKRLKGEFGVEATPHAVDLGVSEHAANLGRECAGVDILVNNAGAIPRRTLAALDEETLRRSWDLKVFGYINLTREIYAAMRGRRRGVILNVAGNSGEKPHPGSIATTSANAMLIAFTRALGAESPDHGVRVLGVNPGLVETERTAALRAGANAHDAVAYGAVLKNLPFGRMASIEEIGNVAAFLVSDRASYVSGTMVTIDGGAVLR